MSSDKFQWEEQGFWDTSRIRIDVNGDGRGGIGASHRGQNYISIISCNGISRRELLSLPRGRWAPPHLWAVE
ncbi:Zinc Finger And Btb Domain-Containing Protein 49 [Manis pentadactyla]|nr:Zinc Finger And Btb Domain-Containing Protein 49 [Manis pentadactyla]